MSYKPYYLEDVYRAEAKARFTVISTFAGGGGSSTGYRLAGGKILAINEFVEEARSVYRHNYPHTPILSEDIRELRGTDFLNVAGIRVGELDVFDGSPPCSSFSMAGIREKGWGKEKAYSDTKQRTDDLFFEYARILKEIQPRFFVAENVAGLTLGSAANVLGSAQFGLFGEEQETIYHTLTRAGYKVRYKVLNAKHFGVPQSRQRLIIVGVRNDIDHVYRFPTNTQPIVSLGEAFEGITHDTNDLTECDISRFAVGKELKKLRPGGQSEKYFSLNKLDPNTYAGTLTATAGCLSAASIAHWQDRKLSVKEAIRVQSFPEDYYLGDTYPNKIERLGRSVPPFLMKKIALSLPF